MAEPTITARIDGIIPPGPFVYHASRGDCLPADLSGLDSDSPDSKVLGDVDKIFEAARATNASCRDEIGGPIDVAAIDSHRVHWLRRKPFAL